MKPSLLNTLAGLVALIAGCSKSSEAPAASSAPSEPKAAASAAPVVESKPAIPRAPTAPGRKGESLPAENLDIVLVKDGKPLHNMFCLPNDEADPTAVVALKEWRDLVKKATGQEPLRVDKPQPGVPTIFFGRNPWSAKAGVATNDLPSEGFRIRSVGQDLHIVGRDTPEAGAHRVEAGSGMEPGTLFGTYEFLERYFGMFFAWHDDLGTVIPRHTNLTVKSMHLVDGPDWSYRQFTKSPEGGANQLFGRRLRLGHPIEVRHEHSWHRIMPPNEHGKAHPEWFAEINGQRYPKHYADNRGGQVCTSNPQVVGHFANAAIAHFNKNPRSDMFSLSPNDGRKFCTCKPCEALDSGELTPAGRRVTTDRILTFYNAVAEKVAMVHPGKRLGGLIYMDYKYPPRRVKPHPMLFLVHATNSGFAQGAFYEGDEWSESAQEKRWGEVAGRFYKYDIWHYDETPLYLIAPVTRHLIEKCRTGARLGVDGAYPYVARSYELLGAGHYLLARLMWDSELDAKAAETGYYRTLYGAAADDVKAYYDLLEDRLRKIFREGNDVKGEPMVASFFERYPGANNPGMYLAAYWPILPQMREIMDRAHGRRVSLSGDEQERLVRLIDHHHLTLHTTAGMMLAGRLLAKKGSAADQKSLKESVAKRDAAKARIAKYRPGYARMLADMDADGHTRILYGKPPTIVVRAPSDFNGPKGGDDE